MIGMPLLLLLPFILQNDYYMDIVIFSGIYILLAIGLNVVVGFTGLLAIGHAAFYGVGAYAMAILSMNYGVPFWLALPFSLLVTAAFSIPISAPALRLRGDYLAIVTLGFGEITNQIFTNWVSLTRGPMGIPGIPMPAFFQWDFGNPLPPLGPFFTPSNILFYYLGLAFVGIGVLASWRLEHSRLGRAWKAIREDESAAEAMGIDTFRLKLLAFVISAAYAGVAGCFFASYTTFVGPSSFTFMESVLVLCMVVLGGRGNIVGVMLGAVLLVFLPEILRGFSEYRMLLFGVALVAVMILRPQGLWGKKE